MTTSMTGFGAATRETADLAVTVSLRAVNHRHLDVQFRLPQAMQGLEPAIRAAIQQEVARGRLECTMTLQERFEVVPVVEIDHALVEAVGRAMETVRSAGLVAGPLLMAAVRESRGGWQRLDLVGALLLGGAVFLGIWGIVHGNDDGWTAPQVLGPLVVAGLLVPAYLLWARGRSYAVLPLRLFTSRSFSVANVIALFFTIGMFGTVFLLAQYLQIVEGYSPLGAGLRTLPWTAAPSGL